MGAAATFLAAAPAGAALVGAGATASLAAAPAGAAPAGAAPVGAGATVAFLAAALAGAAAVAFLAAGFVPCLEVVAFCVVVEALAVSAEEEPTAAHSSEAPVWPAALLFFGFFAFGCVAADSWFSRP